MKRVLLICTGMIVFLSPTFLFASDGCLSQENANILWTLLAAVLVMFMQAGFALVETGFTRAKNAGNILMKNVLDFAIGSILFFLIGFGLMFGTDVGGGLVGSSGFGLSNVGGKAGGDLWTITFWFFQCVFCATAATILSGGMAERTKFSSYLVVSAFVTAFIYPIFGHWAWGSLWLGDKGSGWLEKMGFIDFAGSTVVHSIGGWLALVGAKVLGPRTGKYSPDGRPNAILGHNIPMAALGVFILWLGWFGFNPGSTTTANGDIGYIAVNTNLAAAAGVLGAMFLAWLKFGKPDISFTLNGALAGLVAITAGCAEVAPMGAIIIGFLAGALCVFSVEFLDKVLKIDDPVGAVSVHGVCGAFGTLCVAFFASPEFGSVKGILYGGPIKLLFVQSLGVIAGFAWAVSMGMILFNVLKATIGLRVSVEEEIKGLDIEEHGMEAYNGFQFFTTE
jgi:Amt family ammonium transporter